MKSFIGFIMRIAMFPLNVFMGVTTTDMTGGSSAAKSWKQNGKHFVTAPITVSIPVTGITNDIVKCIPVKAGWLVKGIIYKIVTAGAGSTITLDFGITGGTADGFDAAIDGKTTAGTVLKSTPSDTYPAAGGYYAAADGTIDILLKSISAMTTGTVLTIQAEVMDTNA
jgi:hypothetical protein